MYVTIVCERMTADTVRRGKLFRGLTGSRTRRVLQATWTKDLLASEDRVPSWWENIPRRTPDEDRWHAFDAIVLLSEHTAFTAG